MKWAGWWVVWWFGCVLTVFGAGGQLKRISVASTQLLLPQGPLLPHGLPLKLVLCAN